LFDHTLPFTCHAAFAAAEAGAGAGISGSVLVQQLEGTAVITGRSKLVNESIVVMPSSVDGSLLLVVCDAPNQRKQMCSS
jgi:hypothetical protein